MLWPTVMETHPVSANRQVALMSRQSSTDPDGPRSQAGDAEPPPPGRLVIEGTESAPEPDA
jgi:hypothetical protein